MNESTYTEQPSATGAFFRGFFSSSATGALMGAISWAVTALFTANPIGWAGLAIITLTTGLFGGVMGVKHALFDRHNGAGHEPTYIPVPVQGMAGPAVAPALAADVAPETNTPDRQWQQTVGRTGDAQSRIQEIINNRSISDKDRASALAAAREAELAAPAQQARG